MVRYQFINIIALDSEVLVHFSTGGIFVVIVRKLVRKVLLQYYQ